MKTKLEPSQAEPDTTDVDINTQKNNWKIFDKIDFKDPHATPFSMYIGMRTIKTVMAVLLSGIICWSINQTPLFSMFACILCSQNNTDSTIKSAYNRVMGTIIGGIYAVIIVQITWWCNISQNSLLYYIIISLTILPVICTTLYIKKPTITALSCLVLVAVTLTEFSVIDMNPLSFTIWRIINTLIGVVVLVVLELIFPYHPDKNISV